MIRKNPQTYFLEIFGGHYEEKINFWNNVCIYCFFLSFANQIDFLNCEGEWSVYIDTANDNNIYSWAGDPLAYVDEDLNIYGFNGKYLGWLESQVMYNIDGEPFACIENAYTDYAPYKP